MNGILNMFMRMAMRMVMQKGINMAANSMSRRGKPDEYEDDIDPRGRPQNVDKKMRQQTRMTNRMGRF